MASIVFLFIGIIIGITGEKWSWKSKIKAMPKAGLLIDGIVYDISKHEKQLKDYK